VYDFRYFDGRGAMVRTFRQAAGQGYATADVEYDQMGRVKRASNPYYSAGDGAAINPAEKWTQNTLFDKLGRVREVTLPDGAMVTSSYAGTVVTVTDQAGRQRRQVADALGRVREVHEPDDAGNLGAVDSPVQKTTYEYDDLDNLKKVTQAGSYRGGAQATQVREFKYDSLSRLTHQKQVEAAARLDDNGAVSGSGAWSSVTKYDQWGQVEYAYDARGIVTHFEYDTLNRVKAVTYSGEATPATPAVTYNYGEARNDSQGNPYRNKGRLTSVLTAALGGAPATAQEYDYDKAGQVVAQRQKVGADTYSLSYKYNLAGQLTEQTYPSGRVVRHAFDATARLLATTNAAGTYAYASGLTYAAHGGLTSQTNGNGTAESVDYNARLQPSALTLSRAGEVLQKYAYKYGQVNQDTGAVDEAKNAGQLGKVEGYIGGTASSPTKQWEQRLSYDSLGRLARAGEYRADNSQRSWQSVYSHDRFGNRYQHASEQTNPLSDIPVEAGDVDRSTNRHAPSTGVEYDYSGNVTRDPKFRSLQYRYDANGRQVWAAWLDNTNQATAAYDAWGQRVRTVFNGQARVMVYDVSGRMVAEYGAADGDGGGLRYVFSDRQGSTRAVTDHQGQVQARRDYEPYGKEVPAYVGQRAAQGYGGADGTRQQYAQTERDEGTGLDHTWWRKYEQRSGRWTSPDPYLGSMSTGDPQSFNRYAYVQNDPVNFIDPSGLNRPGSDTRYGGGTLWTIWYGHPGEWQMIHQWFEPYPGGGGSNESTLLDKRLDKATELAKKKLEGKYCSTYIASSSSAKESPTTVLQRMDNRNEVKYGGPSPRDLATGGKANSADTIGRITLYSLAITDGVRDRVTFEAGRTLSRTEFTDEIARALIILHELKHVIGELNGIPGTLHTEGKPWTSDGRWNREILKYCFGIS
jgi:RHS repeat-associated protein